MTRKARMVDHKKAQANDDDREIVVVGGQQRMNGKGFDLDACGEAAMFHLKAYDDKKQAEKKIKETAEDVARLLSKNNRYSITVDGRTVSVDYKEASFAVKVKGARRSKKRGGRKRRL